LVEFLKVLACHRHDLWISRVVAGNAIHGRVGYRRLVGLAPIAELVSRQARPCDENFMNTCQCSCYLAKSTGCVVGFALVLMVAARLNALGLHMVMVKQHDVGFLVIDPNNGVKSSHSVLS
jgi:hypothetical protein